MGQSLMKLAPRSEEKKIKEIGPIIEDGWKTYFWDRNKDWTSAEFCRAVCSIVEEINHKLGNTQFRVPKTEALQAAYNKHHKPNEKLTKEQFEKIVQEVITETGFTGIGAKDTLLYIFGVPVTALFVKQRVMPQAIPNEIFIPGITSLTVLILAKLNKF